MVNPLVRQVRLSFVFFSSFEFARLSRGKTLDCRSLSEFSSSGARWLDFEWHYSMRSKKSFDDSSFSSSKQRRRKLRRCSCCSVSLKQLFRNSSSLTDSSLPRRRKMWSVQKVVTKSISRNVVDLMISSLWLSCFSSVYIYIYVCKKKRFKNETSSLSFSATSGLKRRQQPLFDARECAAVTKQMWREIWRRVATEKIWFFGCLGYEIWKKRKDGPERKKWVNFLPLSLGRHERVRANEETVRMRWMCLTRFGWDGTGIKSLFVSDDAKVS